MDTLNDYYPLYPPNPDKKHIDGEEANEVDTNEYINYLNKCNHSLLFEDWNLKYSDDLWYLWCIVCEFTDTSQLNLFDNLDYPSFCVLCFENSSRY